MILDRPPSIAVAADGKLQIAILLLLLVLLPIGCSQPEAKQTIVQPTAASPTVPPPDPPTATPLPPSPEASAALFLDAWEARDYATMYNLLSPESQTAIDRERFTRRYQNALSAATVLTITTQIQSVLEKQDQAHTSFHLELETAMVGTLITDTMMSLSRHDQRWGVEWDANLIWPRLNNDHYFRMRHSIPVRSNIYDRNGLGLATEGTNVTVGVVREKIEEEEALLETLSAITGLTPDDIQARYATAQPSWRVPVADISAEQSVEHNELLSSLPGVYREEKEGRRYPHGEAAPHVVGWVSPVPAELLDVYRARGYRGDEWVGVSGLEAWGEDILSGQHGGRLAVVTGEDEEVALVAERSAIPSRAIYTTFDRGFQEQVQQIIADRKGAIVVLDARTGAVRALASGPSFNTNIFIGAAGETGRSQVLADPRRPLINRATLGTYPCGSVFKIITMGAGLEELGMQPQQTSFYCPGYWDGLGQASRKRCWKEDGHGDIVLQDGLSASCNVVFYNVGKQVGDEAGPDVLPQYARSFGLGKKTGLEALPEEAGLVPDPAWRQERGSDWWPGDTVNLAIGQGDLKVTPLQIARMMAAVANGGTLLQPYVVDRIEAGLETPEQVTQPEAVGQLPISGVHLAAIQEGLLGVTTSAIGTASHRFAGLDIAVAGKTGTAEAGGVDAEPHSWFAAYAPAGSPEIALAVVVENAGEGSTVAAPMARQVIEAYYGLPLSPLPPQADPDYEPPTPTPESEEG